MNNDSKVLKPTGMGGGDLYKPKEIMIEKQRVAMCCMCGAKNSMYINRQSGKFYCEECFNKTFSCNRCHIIAIHGLQADKLWWCWNCFLKDFYGIVRRRPKTESDFKKIRELSQPIWKRK